MCTHTETFYRNAVRTHAVQGFSVSDDHTLFCCIVSQSESSSFQTFLFLIVELTLAEVLGQLPLIVQYTLVRCYCDGKIHMLSHFRHIGSVFHFVYCLAIVLFLCVIYVLTFVLGSAISPVGDVIEVLTLVLWSAVLPSSSELIKKC